MTDSERQKLAVSTAVSATNDPLASRPECAIALAAEARRLVRQGFKAHDLVRILGVSPAALAAFLADYEGRTIPEVSR